MSAAAARAPHVPHVAAPAVPVRRQRVRVPWRLVASEHYRDAALTVYIKVKALRDQPERCTAGVAVLADWLGMSKSGVERALTQLINPDPEGIVEVPTKRRTLHGGTGTTARRDVRPMAPAELFVWVPVAAADALSPRLLRAYCALAYATARPLPVTAAELAGVLRHHTGPRAGQPIDERSARRLIAELEKLGWITVHRRTGRQARHEFEVHTAPLHLVPTPEIGSAGPDTDDGSGPDTTDGSLASKEDHSTDPPDDTPAASPLRRRRGAGSEHAAPVENRASNQPCAAAPGVAPVSLRGGHNPPPPPAYTGPALTLSPRVWAVLQPVQRLVASCSPYVQRAVAREIGRQLDTGTAPSRLRDRLMARYGRTGPAAIRDTGRWLLGAALPRWGCGLDDCEAGVLWSSGLRCQVCAELHTRRQQHLEPTAAPPAPDSGPPPRPAPAAAPVWHECHHCGAPSRQPLPRGLCAPCRSTTDPPMENTA